VGIVCGPVSKHANKNNNCTITEQIPVRQLPYICCRLGLDRKVDLISKISSCLQTFAQVNSLNAQQIRRNSTVALFLPAYAHKYIEREVQLSIYARPSIHCLYFIYSRKHVKITRQWKSTLRTGKLDRRQYHIHVQ